MAPADASQVVIPKSYHNVPVQHLKLSHHPDDALEATPVIIVTLNRPKQRNAFTAQMMRDFELCYPMFDHDERVKCIVLTGAGDTFCAGADLDMGFGALGGGVAPHRGLDFRDTGGRVNLAIFQCRKPTVVAMNGSAAGVGMTMGLAAAVRIAHASSKYGFVFSRRGITMESNSSFFLPRLVGYSTAIYLLTLGEALRGDSKHFSTLFHEVYEDRARVLQRALEIAINIAENTSGLCSYLSRELMWRGPASPEATHLLESAVGFHTGRQQDVHEGVKSFFEKRSPRFSDTLEQNAPEFYPWWTPVDTSRPTRAKGPKL